MTPEAIERIKVCSQEIAEILYRNTRESELNDLDGIEKSVRRQMLEHVSPEVAPFFIATRTGTTQGRVRTVKSLVGRLQIHAVQAQRLNLKAHSRLSGLLEKACLQLSAKESFQSAEADIEMLTGIAVGHSTQQRLVQRQTFELPEAKQPVSEVSIDGGKVRLRNFKDTQSAWRDYKAVRLGGIYYGGFFQDNLALIDYVGSQPLMHPLVCLGDGHDGIWNLFREIAPESERWEILDWYHLKENLYKVGGSLKRLSQAESLLWQGKTDEAKALFKDCQRKQARNFEAYLDKHRTRIVNYAYYQAEQLCSIGSGAVESAVKQIDRRLQISGARWNVESVNPMLQLRCVYLNGQLAF
ncbi:MAG: ISKra4 family transposase [Leptolyngbyaceae cyanobacterium SM1_4_3]|nr:ISKra4 family transposase [Leptolyngbyaceae cyanobacterium SM1_4_3]